MNFALDAREKASAFYQKYAARVGVIETRLIQLGKDIESVNG
jgi:hypothetical protein